MDADEAATLAIGLVLSVVAAARWYGPLLRVHAPGGRPAMPLLFASPVLCLAVILIAVQVGADPQVRDHPAYIVLFLAAGGTWLGAVVAALPVVLGVGVRDDAVERRNGPAALLACGALGGVAVAYAGANVGAGPTIWTTLGPAALAGGTLAALWLVHAAASRLGESVAVDRNPAVALHAAGLHLATGLVMAGAVAGDWVSVDATLTDWCRRGWPAVVMVMVAIVVDRAQLRRPWADRRRIAPAVVFAVAYVALAAAVWLTHCTG